MIDHIHGLVRFLFFWPLLDCSIDSVWLIVFCLFVWVVVGPCGFRGAPAVAETPDGWPLGAFRPPGARGDGAKNVKTHICCGSL